ncbi:MAG: hypothetical protein ACREMU_03695, partial [Gemmatimonadaceae bacterium]
MPRLLDTAFAVGLALAAPGVAWAQRASFVTTLGRDTLSFEQFERSPTAVTGDWVTLYGGVMVHHYEVALRPNGTVSHYALTLHRLSGKIDGSVD